MDSLERCNNYIFIKVNDIKWAIYKSNSCLYIIACDLQNRGKYECMKKYDIDLLFNLFKQFAENTLDISKHQIIFPTIDDTDMKIKIIFIEHGHELILACEFHLEDRITLELFDVDYNHTCATKQLLKKINVLEIENAEINKTIDFLKEENAKLNDKLNLLASFVDLAMDNNKLVELKKAA